jgi:hypothetical protein
MSAKRYKKSNHPLDGAGYLLPENNTTDRYKLIAIVAVFYQKVVRSEHFKLFGKFKRRA